MNHLAIDSSPSLPERFGNIYLFSENLYRVASPFERDVVLVYAKSCRELVKGSAIGRVTCWSRKRLLRCSHLLDCFAHWELKPMPNKAVKRRLSAGDRGRVPTASRTFPPQLSAVLVRISMSIAKPATTTVLPRPSARLETETRWPRLGPQSILAVVTQALRKQISEFQD